MQRITNPRSSSTAIRLGGHQPGFHGVVPNVANGALLMFVITHVGVPVVRLPESSLLAQQLVGLPRRVSFPALNDLGHRCRTHFKQHMHMIGHHHPGDQPVVCAIEMPQGCRHDRRDVCIPQMTVSMTEIEPCFELYSALTIILDLEQLFPWFPQFFRKAVRQTKGHKLSQTRLISMWQVATLMPALKARDLFLVCRLRRGLLLSVHKLSEFRPMRNHDARKVNKERGFAIRSSTVLGKKCPCWSAAFGCWRKCCGLKIRAPAAVMLRNAAWALPQA